MEKVYVLLRHDKQTGPYSLTELIQFDLKPYDLIWIEGRSAGWYYPQEIAALHPYLAFLPQKPKPAPPAPVAEKTVFVQTPVVSEAPKATPSPTLPPAAPEQVWQPTKAASPNLEAAVYAQFTEPAAAKEASFAPAAPAVQKRKSPHPALVGVATVLIVGGVFAASWMLNRGVNQDDNTTEAVADAAAPNEITPMAVAADDNTNQQPVARQKPKGQKNNSTPTHTVATGKQNTQSNKETIPSTDVAGHDETSQPVSEEENVQTEEALPAPAETPSAPQEKKKSFKEKIVDLFRKKPAEGKAEERRPAENENGKRVATRREGTTDLAQLVHVRFDIPNSWMMGIKGAKATMVNRSAEKITGASVEILYYNDDNELLQKKTVSFGKIDAKETRTITIPDHPTATKVDYNVISVTGQPAA